MSSRGSSRVRDSRVIANSTPTRLDPVNGAESGNLGDQTFVEGLELTSLVVPSSHLPPEREKAFRGLPFSIFKADISHNVFDREFLKTTLGNEGLQSLMQRYITLLFLDGAIDNKTFL